ncbi:MAG TPA: SAM-dependent methyltransferase [Candidatus Acidoferrales bacterium]|nr:SAM-dependent methyltransferase [Candidatus Acidoferrales bacterium]
MTHRYIAFADRRFISKAWLEIRLMLLRNGGCKMLPIPECEIALAFETPLEPEKLFPLFESKKLTYVDSIMTIRDWISNYKTDLSDIEASLLNIAEKGKSFKIEARRIDTDVELSAKTIEVQLGRKLETGGFVADLKGAQMRILVALIWNNAIIAADDTKSYNRDIDKFRLFNPIAKESVSRAEFKLLEAMEIFGVNPASIKRCIDLGAAPGGWSAVMMKSGSKVIAIDNAALDYESLSKLGKVEITDADVSPPDKWDLLHIKANVMNIDAETLDALGPVDAILVDMNIESDKSAIVIDRFTHLLKPGGVLILTIKLVDERAEFHVENAQSVLTPFFENFRVKKLQHNRMELTMYATKKHG